MAPNESAPDQHSTEAESLASVRAELERTKAWQARILQALDHLQSGLVMYGPDDVLVFCNRRFREIYPEIADILVPGTPYSEIARTFYQREFHRRTEMTEDEYVSTRVKQHLNPDECDDEYLMGPETWILASDRKTADGGVIGFRLDISERKRAEKLLAETEMRVMAGLEQKVKERTQDLLLANQNLEQALSDLRGAQRQLVQSEKLASLGFLVAGVAHEINTPIGNALLVGTSLREEIDHFSEQSSQRVTRSLLEKHIDFVTKGSDVLVSNLKRAGKLVQGFKQLALDRATEQRREFVLVEVIDEVLLAMGPTLRMSPFKLDIQVPADLTMDSYPGPLSQIIVNFINNALVHAFEGRQQGHMVLDASINQDKQIEIVFSDDGCGMSEDVANHVFDPFFTTKLGQGGNGLGMHIAYNIVTQLLGGTITVDTEVGRGTSWRMTFPRVLKNT
ncbi:ATP-binding protein [Undibacterium cyanobacteriorum]|uniref:histidine kinase n=1 Tax=Undibacterium cyanobacteriorum TaxID=3073561 RepID=A0ABY9RN10_9BURK|nr:ATP-binding protein [Undibacterium sp. 20NA77.5]WMW81807.1 ATP-binding protein [Undibacterium sp. 20NA77.5]